MGSEAGHRVSFRLEPRLAEWVTEREERRMSGQGLARALRTELMMLQELLEAELRRQPFTLADIGLIADVCNGSLDGTFVGNVLAVDLAAAFATYPGLYGARWGVDEGQLLGRVREMGPAADLAVRDAVQRWLHSGGEHSSDAWRAAGLSVVD